MHCTGISAFKGDIILKPVLPLQQLELTAHRYVMVIAILLHSIEQLLCNANITKKVEIVFSCLITGLYIADKVRREKNTHFWNKFMNRENKRKFGNFQ